MQTPLSISTEETTAAEDDRFHRFKLIGWWDQAKLARAKVLVIGAGALGNEIIKNLVLLGIGNILIADKDTIENSNLSRSVLYRAGDNGKFKAEVAAAAAKQIYPDLHVHAYVGDIINDLGLGVYRWADVVIGGLDNREARLSINRNCWKVNKPWIDGAIEQIDGVARVFVPDGPCYECTMSKRDWDLIRHRRSCNLLTRAEMQGGKTPTTPTVSSIIAGVQTQEAVKLLHGMPVISGKGWVFSGLGTDAYQTEYQRKADCYSHDTLDEIISLDATADTLTVRQLMKLAADQFGQPVPIEIAREVLHKLVCPKCKQETELFASPGSVKAGQESCPNCGAAREVVTFSKIRGEEDFLDRTLAQIGVPAFDILIARGHTAGGSERAVGFELGGDIQRVLGPLVEGALEVAMSQTVTTELDASAVASGDWPIMNAPRTKGRREGGFQTIVRRSVLDQVHEHGRATTDVEICGVLVGNVFTDEFGPYLYITDAIAGDAASEHAAQVTFTAETWDHIQNEMDAKHAGKKIVGWYHTHPGFDIFLSGMDLFIQDNFFNLPWQVAFVYDPIGEKEGLFVWRKGKSEKEAFLVEEDAAVEAIGTQVLPDLQSLGKGPITKYKPTLYLTAFLIMFLGTYVGLVQTEPGPHFAPRIPSPGLQDESAKDFDPSQMLEQMDDQSADEPAVDPHPAPPVPAAHADNGPV